ncbi:sister-chromatid cohesion protein 3-like isoform X1 [Solanum tuberosum]|uniref:sister-chromatid cohesion protein 3-like isoform X1 n=1 Tax=Solanum tuberosum TaxID=4113 RepID=UPI0003D282F6|nr:PREDICTED: sister-chromatid cohesion protein 3-like isoform X1 [Solanum tuberosum]XP_015160452.1 PREDICTED: sister-chromatid cohesion protein 3-like isoform X1 [Solanum tuberosum]
MLLEEELSAELSDEDATNLIRLLFASTRKAVLEKIVPASDNKKKYYTKAQKDVFEISKSDITISMMRNYPQLPHKFMSDKAKIHHLLEIIVHMNLERDSLKRQDQNFTSAVLLKKRAFLKHGVKEALRSRVKAVNFCATVSCGELQDFALNKFKGIEDELVIKLKSALKEVADGDDEYSLLF